MSDNPIRPGASSIAEFAKRNGLGRTTAYREIQAGRLKAVKVRDRTVILDEHEREWRQNLRLATPHLASA